MVPLDRGQWWSRSADAEAWYEELGQRGFSEYFSGKLRAELPEAWLTPETAPQIGSRVRLATGSTTLGGTHFEAGELAIVSEIHLMPVGGVWLTLRTVDGRKCKAMSRSEYEPA